MKPTIIARDKNHLITLIKDEIKRNGSQCDLNHIDVYHINDMSYLFVGLQFNGDISKWNVSKVENMSNMFFRSEFNGDISNWDVSRVEDMSYMFGQSDFNQDLSKWKPYSVNDTTSMFIICPIKEEPYWIKYEDIEHRKRAIDKYILSKELEKDLSSNDIKIKKVKI
jgi:surface protein